MGIRKEELENNIAQENFFADKYDSKKNLLHRQKSKLFNLNSVMTT